MKKFKFSLESVLKYKVFLAKEAEQQLMSINMDIKECEEYIEQLKSQRIKTFEELDKKRDQEITIESYQIFQNYISSLEEKAELEQKRLHSLYREKDVRTKKLIEARKEKEVLEKLKDKKKKKHVEDMLYEEQKELDEISSLKQARGICNEN